MEEQINHELLQIMQAEQDVYRASLLAMPPEEILNNAWEYTAREDILMALDVQNIPVEQAKALLRSPSPLAEVTKEYRDQDVDDRDVFIALEGVALLHGGYPIYRFSFQYATEHEELDAYFASIKANNKCVASIVSAINGNYRDNRLATENALKSVLGQHSADRVQIILAWQIKLRPWEGRYSRANKEWAASVDTAALENSGTQLYINCHQGLIDLFTTAFRREVMEQSRGETSVEKADNKSPERSDDLEL